MFRPSTIATSTWAISASHFGFVHPITIAALILPWVLYEAYVAMITADEKTLDAVSPANTIIIFDLHGVLFKSDVFGMFKLIAFSPCAWRIFIHFLNPFFLYDLFELHHHKYIFEYYLLFLTKKYESLQPCLPLLFRAANLQIPVWKTIELVSQLKNRGYTVHLFSNIGEHLYADLDEQYPDIFRLFDAIYIGSKENNYRGKPHPLVFYNYIAAHPANGKQRLLIDDKARNIAFARAFNIAGIRYRSAASLQKWFKRHGIL
jgi:FMN phosphatase YigB (HAD superfamily)